MTEDSVASPILVIDDSDVDRETMCALLEKEGFAVHQLPSPIGATRLARQLKVKVVVIDQNLPAMDGSKLAGLFHRNPLLESVRVVLVSGIDENQIATIARDAGADAYVTKRSMHDDLAKIVRRLAS